MPTPKDAPEPSTPSASTSARFRPRDTTFFLVSAGAVLLLTTASAIGVLEYYHSSYWHGVGLARDQPVLFSHRHHAGELGIDCRYCHATVETSAFAGMPATQTCLNCHSQLFTDTSMLAPIVRSAARDQPIAWTRVTRLPDHVYFNHSAHLAKNLSCATCHGDVEQMALTAKAQPLDMRWCLDCHRTAGTALTTGAGDVPASRLTSCSTCHH